MSTKLSISRIDILTQRGYRPEEEKIARENNMNRPSIENQIQPPNHEGKSVYSLPHTQPSPHSNLG